MFCKIYYSTYFIMFSNDNKTAIISHYMHLIYIYICNGHNANNAVLTTAHSSCSCARAIHKLLPAWKQKYKYVVHGTDISTLSAAFCISDNHDLIVLSGFVDFDVNYCEETGINANKALIDPC